MFNTLHAEEIKSSQKWARDNFTPGITKIEREIWHPIVVKECELMEDESISFDIKLNLAEIRIVRKVMGTEMIKTNGMLTKRENDRMSKLVFGTLCNIVTEANKKL